MYARFRNDQDLRRIFENGGNALNIGFSEELQSRAVHDCFKNAGILQRLILGTLEEAGVDEEQDHQRCIDDEDAYENACLI